MHKKYVIGYTAVGCAHINYMVSTAGCDRKPSASNRPVKWFINDQSHDHLLSIFFTFSFPLRKD